MGSIFDPSAFLAKHGDLDILHDRLIQAESAGNPTAVGPETRYGTAKGLGQLLDTTGQEVHKELNIQEPYDPFNPEQNHKISKYYLKKLYDKYQDPEKALMAYNWGPGNVDNWLNSGAIPTKVPQETREYVKKILSNDISSRNNRSSTPGVFDPNEFLGRFQSDININEVFSGENSPYSTANAEDIEVNQQSLFTNMGHALLQGWDETQLSGAEDRYYKNKDIINRYNQAVKSGDQRTIYELQPLLEDAYTGMSSAEEDINTNLQEIQENPVNNAYLFKEQFVSAQGSKSDLIDQLAYTMPHAMGSSLPLMIPNLATAWGSQLFQRGLSAGLAQLAVPEPMVSKIAGAAILLAGAAAGIYSAYQEAGAERSQAINTAKEALFAQWQEANPGINFEDLSPEQQQDLTEKIEIQAMTGADQLFNQNLLGVSIENIVSNTLFFGSTIPGVIGNTIRSTNRVGKAYRDLADYNKFTRLAGGVGTKYAGVYLPEKWEEGFQYAAQQRQFDAALDLGMYENEGFMSNFLADGTDVLKSLNYSPFGVLRNDDGRYSLDPKFQTSEETGGLMALIFGAVPAVASVGSDLITYRKYNDVLKKSNPFINADEKINELKSQLYFDAFSHNNVHHLIEGLKTLKSTKGEDGKPLLTEDQYDAEVQNIKNAYEKYQSITEYTDELFGAKFGAENKALKREFNALAYISAMNSSTANSDFGNAESEFQEGLGTLAGTLRQNENLGVMYKLQVANTLLKGLDEKIKESKDISTVYNLTKKREALNEYIKELNTEAKEYSGIRKIPNMTPEFTDSATKYVVSRVNKDTNDSIYDEILGLKNTDDIKKYLDKIGRQVAKKKAAVESINKEIKDKKEAEQKAAKDDIKDAVTSEEDVPGDDSLQFPDEETDVSEEETEGEPDKDGIKGYIQKTETLEEVPFYTRVTNAEGIDEFEIKDEQGNTKVVSNKEGWYPSVINKPSTGKERLNDERHFSDLFSYNLNREKAKLKEIAKRRALAERAAAGLPEVKDLEPTAEQMQAVYDEYSSTQAFIAIKSRKLLDKVLKRADWRNYIKLVATKAYTSKPEQLTNRVVFENLDVGIRGVRKTGIDILMHITDPDTGEVSTLNHAMNPDFYEFAEVRNGKVESEWKKWSFLDMPYSAFVKRFEFLRDDKMSDDAKHKMWLDLKEDYKNLVEFERKVRNAYTGADFEVPVEWYQLSPIAAVDWLSKDAKDLDITDVPLLAKAPIVFMASNVYEDVTVEKRPPGVNLPELERNRGSYLALAQADNGAYKWIRVYPKAAVTKADQDEVLSKLLALRDQAKGITNADEDLKDKLAEINLQIPLFIKNTGSYRVLIEAWFPPSENNLITNADLRVVVIKNKRRIGQRYMGLASITNWTDLINFINSVRVPAGEVYNVNPKDIRLNLPKEATNVPDAQKNFVSSVKPNVFRSWSIQFNFNPKEIVTPKPPAKEDKSLTEVTPSIESKKADIERRRQEELNQISDLKPNKTGKVSVDIGGGKFELQSFKVAANGRVIFEGQKTDTDLDTIVNEINTKYDAELAALEGTPGTPSDIVKGLMDKGVPREDAERIAKEQQRLLDQSDEDVSPFSFNPIGDIQSIEQANELLKKRLPKNFEIKDIDTILSRLKTNQLPLGTVIGSTLYLHSNHNTGVFYHEAFHAVFRNLLDEFRINAYLRKAKEEMNFSAEDLKAKIQEIKNSDEKKKNLSDKEAEELVYEEYLADKYSEYVLNKQVKSWLKELFEKIKALFNWIIGNPDLHSLFSRIESGAFRTSSIKRNRFTTGGAVYVPYKLIKGLSAYESKDMVNRVVGNYLSYKGLKTRNTLDDIVTDLENFYNPYLQGNIEYAKTLDNSQFVLKEMERIFISLTLEGDTKTPSTRALLKDEATRILRRIKTNPLEEEQDALSTSEDNLIQFDISENQRKPSDRTTRRVKEFLSTIQYEDTDLITKKKYMKSLAWEDMYDRLLVLLNLDSIKDNNRIPEVLKAVGTYSPQINSVYQALKAKVGLENDVLTDPDFFTEFKNAFKLRQALFGNVVVKNERGSTNTETVLFIPNRLDLAWEKISQWRDAYIKQGVIINSDKKLRNKLLAQIDDLIGRLDKKPAKDKSLNTVALAREIFNTIGLDFQQAYLELSFGDNQELKEAFKDKKLITKKYLSEIRSNVSNNKDLFSPSNTKMLRNMSTTDSILDDNLILKSYTNAEGKSQYSYVPSNLIYERVSEFKNNLNTAVGIKEFKKNPYYALIPIVNDELSPKTFSNLQVILTGNSENELSKKQDNARSMKHSDKLSYTVIQHALFNQRENINGQDTNYYWLTQIGEKNTQYAVRLSEKTYYANGLTESAREALLMLVKQQINRVNGDYGDKFTTKDHILFPFLNDYQFKNRSFEEIKDSVINSLEVIFSEMIESHIAYLDNNDLWGYISHKAFSEKFKSDKTNYVGNFIVNDFINTVSLLEMIGGDLAWAKSWEDFVKRSGSLIASGPDFGDGVSTFSFMQDTVTYADTKNNWAPVTEDEAKSDPERYVKITVDDAQTYSTDVQKLYDLTALGRMDNSTRKALEYISNPVVEGRNNKLRYEAPNYNPVDSDQKVDLISSKQVVRGRTLTGEELYVKTTVFYITRELASWYDTRDNTWKPLTGMEKLHNIYEYLTRNNINFLAPKSAYKLYFPNNSKFSQDLYKSSDLKTETVQISDKFRRLQVELDTKKQDRIPITNQELNIIGSELSSPEAKRYRDAQKRILNSIKQRIFEDIKKVFDTKDLSNLYTTVQNALEEHTGDSQMIQFLEVQDGKPKYDTNLIHISHKLEEIFFSKFKSVFQTKIHGRKLTHVSPEGFTVLYNLKTGEIIPRELERLDPVKYQNTELYGTRELKFGEVLLPRKFKDLKDVFPGTPLFDKLFGGLLGKRIPTQSYHSLDVLKVVDFLPDYYGDIVIAHKEIYALMGADNDADALYTYMPAWYKNEKGEIKLYGEEIGTEEKFEAYVTDLFNSNIDLKRMYNTLLEQDSDYQEVKEELSQLADQLKGTQKKYKEAIKEIASTFEHLADEDYEDINHEVLWLKKDIGAIRNYLIGIKSAKGIPGDFPDELAEKVNDALEGLVAGKNYNRERALKAFNLPSNEQEYLSAGEPEALSSLTNQYLAITTKILSLPELKEANNQPLSTEPIKRSLTYLRNLEGPQLPVRYLPNSILAKFDAYGKQFLSKGLVGVSVNGNSAVQYLTEMSISLNEDFYVTVDGKRYETFSSSGETSRVKFHNASAIVGAVVDSAKDPVAHLFNWGFRTLIPRNILGGLSTINGELMDPDTAALIIKQPVLQELTLRSESARSPFSKVSAFNILPNLQSELHTAFFGLRKLIFDNQTLTDQEKADLILLHDQYQDPGNLKTEDMENSLRTKGNKPVSIQDQIRHYGTQYQVLKLYTNIDDISNYLRNTLTGILKTNRTLGKSVQESSELLESFITLREEPNAPLNGLDTAVSKDELLSGNEVRLIGVQDILSEFFIKLSPFFQDLKRRMRSSFSKSDENLDVSLMTFLSMQIIKNRLKNKGVNPLEVTSELLLGEKSLAKRITSYRNPETNKNPFVKFIKSLAPGARNNKSSIWIVSADSRTKLSPETTDLLINGFNELMMTNKPLAIDLMRYLIVKDNLQFADQSFIKYIVPTMFSELSSGLSQLNSAVKGAVNEDWIKEITGKTPAQLRQDFVMTYGIYKPHGQFIKIIDKDKLKVNLGGKGEDANEIQVFSYDYQDNKIFMELKTSDEKALRRFRTFPNINGVYDFPVLIRGAKKHKGVYVLSHKTDTSAQYTKLPEVEVKGVKPWLLDKEYSELPKKMKTSSTEDTEGLLSTEQRLKTTGISLEEFDAMNQGFADPTDDLMLKMQELENPENLRLNPRSPEKGIGVSPEGRSSSNEPLIGPQGPSKGVSGEQKPLMRSQKHSVKKVISGGQTGVDLAGLDAALEVGINTGGTAAAKFQQSTTGDKKIFSPDLATKYGLKEGKITRRKGKFGEYDDVYYQRTIDNAQEADGTIWFGKADSPGGKLTLGDIAQKGKSKPLINPKSAQEILDWLNKNNIKVLNVAGNREHTNPGIYKIAKDMLVEALGSKLETKNKNQKMQLKDGNWYTGDQINAKMLTDMGYSPEESGEIIKKMCK